MRHAFIAMLAAATLIVLSGPAAQARDWPWCADLRGEDGSATNCGFASWEQCQGYISGIGGWCYPNPYYRGEARPRRRDKRQR
jgi:hypothetical protein